MRIQEIILILITLSIADEVVGSPLKFPDDASVGQGRGASSGENIEARFHHHRKKKRKKHGCGQNRFKRADPQGRFFFPILNYYDTNVYITNGGGNGEGPDEGCGGGGGSGIGGVGSGLGGGLGSVGSGLGGGLGSLGSGLGGGLGSLGSGLPSIGSGILPLGPIRPSASVPASTRPPPILPTYQPVPSRPPAPVATTDPDNEDYDYTDFSTTTRYSRPSSGTLSDYPVINSLSNSLQRPQRVFNQYVVRPFNKTIREFYSLF